MIIEVSMLTRMPISEVMDLDMYSLTSLAESVFRIKYRDKLEEAWTRMLAAQGKSQDMEKWAKRWKPALGRTFKRAAKTIDSFMTKYGKGI